MGSGKSGQVVGYRYFLGADLKWCHAPIDSMNKIYIDDRLTWEGSRRNQPIEINQPELFGEFEGGVQGTLDLLDGDPTQGQNDYLVGVLGSGVPAFRGVTSTVLRQMYLGNNPYLKGWKADITRIKRRLMNGVVIPQWNDFYAPVPPFSDNEDGYNTLNRFFGGTLEPQQILIQVDLSSHTNGFRNNNMNITGQGQDIENVKRILIAFLDFLEEDVTWVDGSLDIGIAFFRGSTGATSSGSNSSGSGAPIPFLINEGNLYNAPRRGVFSVVGASKGADIDSLRQYVLGLTVFPDTAELSSLPIGENATEFFTPLSTDRRRVNYTFSSFDFPAISESVVGGDIITATGALNAALNGGTGTPSKVAFVPTGTVLEEYPQDRPETGFYGYTDPAQMTAPTGWVEIPGCNQSAKSDIWGIDWLNSPLPEDQIGTACGSPAGYGISQDWDTEVPPSAGFVIATTFQPFGIYAGRDYPYKAWNRNSGNEPFRLTYQYPDGTLGDKPLYEVPSGGQVTTEPPLEDFLENLLFETLASSGALDMNPAHIIREALTDQQWGLGIPEEEIDEDSFYASSVTLWNERFGLSLAWNKQTDVEEFIKTILNHIDAVLYVRRDTGRWTLKLIRYDYDPDTIPVFTDDDVVSWDQVTRKSEAELVNSVTVKFNSRSLRNPASLTVNNLAQIQQLGAVVPATVNYPGIWQQGLASVVAERDLRSLSTATISGSISVTRRGATLYPGDVFRLSSSRYSLAGEIMRVVEVNIGDGRDNAVYIKFAQDVFNLGTIPITGGPSSEWQEIWNAPQPVDNRVIEEEGYRSFFRRNGEQLAQEILTFEPNVGYISAFGQAPTPDSINARIRYDAGAGYTGGGLASFCPTATLSVDASRNPLDNTWVLTNPVALSSVREDTLAYVGGEYVRVDSVNTTTNTITVGRGCLDTPPDLHVAGTRIYFFEGFAAFTTNQFVDSDVVSVKLLTNSSLGQLPESLAPVDTLEFDARINRPYPVGALKVNDSYESQLYTGTLTVTWAHRDRALQTGDIPEDHTAGNIGPEAGVAYTVKGLEYDLNNVFIGELFSFSVGTATSQVIDTTLYPMTVSPGYVKIEVQVDRGGLLNRKSAYINTFSTLTPAQLEAFGWYDANVFSSMFLDNEGQTPITFDQDPIGLMENQRGTIL